MGILFSPSLSLSAGRKRKSVYFNYLAERLQPTTPPTIPISSPLPAHQPVSRPRLFTNQPIEGQQLSITASLPLHWSCWWKSALFVTPSECWSWRYSPIPKCLEIFIKRKKNVKRKRNWVSFYPLQICYRKTKFSACMITPQDSETLWAANKMQPYDADQPCPCLCAVIIFTTIPPGNKQAAPTPPPAVPLPPLSIWPLNSSALPLQMQTHKHYQQSSISICNHLEGWNWCKEETVSVTVIK